MALRFDAAIRTRTARSDYVWVGNLTARGTAHQEWWRSGWGNPLLHEGACLLRDASENQVRLLLTGIQSNRHDSTSSHTRIAYDLLLESNEDGGVTQAQVREVVRAWWLQRATGDGTAWPLGIELDRAVATIANLQSCSVDELLVGQALPGLVSSVFDELGMVSGTGPSGSEQQRNRGQQSYADIAWIGADAEDAEQLVLRGGSMVYCRDLTRNHLPDSPSPSTMQQRLGVSSGVVVVVDDSDEVHRYPKADPPVPGDPTNPRQRSLRLLPVALGILLLLLILVMALAA